MNEMKIPKAPLYRDPIYDGPTDPVIIYNREEECFFMLYTSRRASDISIGVSSIHGTHIGVASSKDGVRWLYRGTIPNLEFEPGHNTFWAPEVIYVDGTYHMYVTYVRGIPTDWNWERHIVHYTATNMWEWTFQSILELSSNRVIDACVYEVEPGTYKMWYKDEVDNSYTYSATSTDLYHWTVLGKEISDVSHEGPNVFELGGNKWMITDFWKGIGVYSSKDYTNWERKSDILHEPGTRDGDDKLGHHADVVVCGGEAYIFYFTHCGFLKNEIVPANPSPTFEEAKTCIQVARLTTNGEEIFCNRDEVFELKIDESAV